jgi:hypothetical protein
MMRKLALLAGVLAALAIARPALAQGPFADVPTDHWAYDAVNELAKQGIINGYPDSTFGGKRALTRYEFAIAIQRGLQEVQRRIDAAVMGVKAPDLSNYVTKQDLDTALQDYAKKADVDQLRKDLDQLRSLMTTFQDTLAALGTDVDQLKRDVAALGQRLTALETEVHKMPKITGNAMVGFYGSYRNKSGNPVGATDIDNRPLSPATNVLQGVKSVYDIDLGITARLSDVATAHLLLNAGNYLGGYLNNSLSTVQPFYGNPAGNQTAFENVTPYYLYIDTPISLGSLGASITVGKFGQQFTPYTLKMVDVDSYFDNEKTDNGDYNITGGRVNFKIGGFGIQAYAGQHNTVAYSQPSSTAGIGPFPVALVGSLVPGGGPFFEQPTPATTLTQSAGAHVTVGIPFKGRIGGTYLQGGSSNVAGPNPARLQVYGGDVEVAPVKYLRIEGEYAESKWSGNGFPNPASQDRRAWDGKVIVPIGKLELNGQYRRIGFAFDAPGNWGKIGRWFNPRNIEGYGGGLRYPFSSRLALVADAHDYRFLIAGSPKIHHYEAGLKFGLTSTNSVDLGYEQVSWTGVGVSNKEHYYNIGLGHDFNANTSFKVLYQYIVNEAGTFPGVLPTGTLGYDGGVAVTEFSVRF